MKGVITIYLVKTRTWNLELHKLEVSRTFLNLLIHSSIFHNVKTFLNFLVNDLTFLNFLEHY